MYAIQHKRTKKWLTGTDFRRDSGPYQFTSFDHALLFPTITDVMYAWYERQVGKSYRVVSVRLEAVEAIPDKDWTEAMDDFCRVKQFRPYWGGLSDEGQKSF
jgi:hypothetical protein